MKKHEEFDLEIAIERIQKKYPYEDIAERIAEFEFKLPTIDYDEYEETDMEFAQSEDSPSQQIVEEILEWYEKAYGKLSKSEKDDLRSAVCYNYEIDFD